MNTTNPAFITLSDRTLDPMNREQVASLIRQVDAMFRLAAKAWERGERACDNQRNEAEALLAPLGVKCSYPGLYPCFTVNGFEEHETRAAVLVALGHPRSFILARDI